jgi:hypothetical protein
MLARVLCIKKKNLRKMKIIKLRKIKSIKFYLFIFNKKKIEGTCSCWFGGGLATQHPHKAKEPKTGLAPWGWFGHPHKAKEQNK